MADFNMRSMMVSTIAAMLILSIGQSMIEASKIPAQVDLYVVMTKADDDKEYPAIKEAYKTLVGMFELHETKTKVGIASYIDTGNDDPDEMIVLNATSDETEFKNAIDKWTPGSEEPEPAKTYEAIKNKPLSGSRGKVVVVALPKKVLGAENAADLMPGVKIYAIAPNENPAMDQTKKMTGRNDSAFPVQGKSFAGSDINSVMSTVKEAIFRDLCAWRKLCRFDTPSDCIFYTWEYHQHIDRSQCELNKPPMESCKKEDCEKDCDKGWPWMSSLPDCNKTCGQSSYVQRNVKEPPSNFEHCPKSFKCGDCKDDTKAVEEGMSEMWIVITAILVVMVVLVVATGIGVFIFLRQRTTEIRATERKVDRLVDSVNTMSMYMAQQGAEAGMAADMSGGNATPGGKKAETAATGSAKEKSALGTASGKEKSVTASGKKK